MPGSFESRIIAKLSIVVEEADETLLWLEMLSEAGITNVDEALVKEAKEILFIMSASRKSAKGRDNQ